MNLIQIKKISRTDKVFAALMAVGLSVLILFAAALTSGSLHFNAHAQVATSTTDSTASTTPTTTSTTTASSTLPSIPLNLMATPISSNQINLSWSPSMVGTSASSSATSTGNSIWGYNIYRNSSFLISATSTSYQDTGLNPGTTYTYNVAAGDTAGNLSGQSSSALATTFGTNSTTTPGTSTSTPGTSTSTPGTSNPSWTDGNAIGWMAIPLSLFNQIGGSSTTTPSTGGMSITYDTYGYPKWNGSYINCDGMIDNDPAHHAIDPNDKDPGHHVGMNCPGGGPKTPTGMGMGNSGMGGMNNMNFWMWTNGQMQQWVLVPLNKSNLQKIMNYLP